MNIVVINGSPKGDESVTKGYAKYIAQNYGYEFKFLDIGKSIKKLRCNRDYLLETISYIKKSDIIIWATPVYYFLVPGQLVEFVDLIREEGLEKNFQGKLATYLTTSIHFFDSTAKSYLEKTIKSLQMKLFVGLQFKMYDLLEEKNRDLLDKFSTELFSSYERNNSTVRKKELNTKKKVLVVGDYNDSGSYIYNMINEFKSNFVSDIEVVDINSIGMKSGCLGCCTCGWDNRCVLTKRDEHNEFYKKKMKTADIIVCAAELKGDFFSPTWKYFLDRAFFVNHAPYLNDKQFAWLVSGDLTGRSYITEFMDSWAQCNYSNFVGYVSDSDSNIGKIAKDIEELAINSVNSAEKEIKKPYNFLGVGGKKIFRDEIYGPLRFPFRKDHESYKKMDYYDFPQKDFRSKIKNLIITSLCKVDKIREKILKPRTMIKNMYIPVGELLRDN